MLEAATERRPNLHLLLAMLLAASLGTDPKESFDPDDACNLLNQLFAGINPNLPENAYMPPLLREKLTETLSGIRNKTIHVKFIGHFLRDSKNRPHYGVLMAADVNEADQKIIYIFVPRVVTLVRKEHRTPAGYGDLSKDVFAIALAHEAIHFEKLPLPNQKDDAFHWEEERAWQKTIVQIIRPLKAAGRPIGGDFQTADRILRACNDRLPCFDFTNFIAKRSAN